jgi:hypothetical protein
MQDGEKDGCWFMTIGHVFYQEPIRVVSQIFYSPVQNYFQTAVFQYVFTLTAGEIAAAIAHQKNILEIQKPAKVLSWT